MPVSVITHAVGVACDRHCAYDIADGCYLLMRAYRSSYTSAEPVVAVKFALTFVFVVLGGANLVWHPPLAIGAFLASACCLCTKRNTADYGQQNAC